MAEQDKGHTKVNGTDLKFKKITLLFKTAVSELVLLFTNYGELIYQSRGTILEKIDMMCRHRAFVS